MLYRNDWLTNEREKERERDGGERKKCIVCVTYGVGVICNFILRIFIFSSVICIVFGSTIFGYWLTRQFLNLSRFKNNSSYSQLLCDIKSMAGMNACDDTAFKAFCTIFNIIMSISIILSLIFTFVSMHTMYPPPPSFPLYLFYIAHTVREYKSLIENYEFLFYKIL